MYGVIGCPSQAILARFACFASFFCRVWLPFSHALPASSRSYPSPSCIALSSHGVIGCPTRPSLHGFSCFISFFCRVWLPSLHALPALSRSSTLHHPARFHLFNFHFPHDVGCRDAWCRGPCVPKLWCIHTTKKVIVSYWINNKDNQTRLVAWFEYASHHLGSTLHFRLSMTKTTNHVLSFHFPHNVGRHNAHMV